MKNFKKDYILKDAELLTIRTPELGDEQDLIDQMKLVDSETRFLTREEGEFGFTLEQEREFIKNCLEDENRLFLLAEIKGRIIGNCSVGVISNNKRYLHRATMGIAVCKEYWNKSIGGKLMQECINWCKEKGLEQLELEVVTQNTRAISMYNKFGFQVQGIKKHALKYGDGTYADEFHMILFLENDQEHSMINGVNHITFAVSDLEKSLEFYVDLLGLTLVGKWNHGAYLLAGNQWIALNVDGSIIEESKSDYTHVAFNVLSTDFNKMKDKLENAGIKEFKLNSSEGESFYFLDPDGHKLELHYNNLEDRLKWAKENDWSSFEFNEG